MSIQTKDQFDSAYEHFKRVEEPRDIVMFYHKVLWEQSGGKCGFSVMDKDEMKPEMRTWRQQIRDGKVVCKDYNNKSVKTEDGREWHILVIQDAVEGRHSIDCIGMFLLSFMVDGNVYAFKRKSHRDQVFDYINKKKK